MFVPSLLPSKLFSISSLLSPWMPSFFLQVLISGFYVYVYTYTLLNLICLVHIILLAPCFQCGPFGVRSSIGVFFPWIILFLACSALLSWLEFFVYGRRLIDFPCPLWHDYWCYPCSVHTWVVMLVWLNFMSIVLAITRDTIWYQTPWSSGSYNLSVPSTTMISE